MQYSTIGCKSDATHSVINLFCFLSFVNSLYNYIAYPSEANPVLPPTVTRVPGTTAVYEVDIFDSIPLVDGVVGGYGTVIVRVQDLSSNGGFSYFAMVCVCTCVFDCMQF